jgi:hypothetical protein
MLKKLTLEEFITKSKLIHKDKYDYSLVEYVNSRTKVTIVCPSCGEFEQLPNNHLYGYGCKKCSLLSNTNDFISKAKSIHGDRYDYSSVDYKHNRKAIVIICPKHGEFLKTPHDHLNGRGCPKCRMSFGETLIKVYLDNRKINYTQEKTYDACVSIKGRKLPFDFFLSDLNILIEYDGEHHNRPLFGNVEKFEKQIENDVIKTNYCLENNIPLIRINSRVKDPIKLLEATLQNKITQA